MKIGVFDSGFGGLDIFRHMSNVLPEYDFVYLGDTARTPYGTRSQETIYEYTEQAIDFLFDKECQLIILACNTASAETLPKIQQGYLIEKGGEKRVLGVIIPAAEIAAEITANKKVGVMATESSVKSGAFERELHKLDSEIEVFQQSCPLLVPIVESGDIDNEDVLNPILDKYIQPLLDSHVDTIILGCTHYGVLKPSIDHFLKSTMGGEHIRVVSEGEVVAQKLKTYLGRHPEIESTLSKDGSRDFYTTDLTENFQKVGSQLMGEDIEVEKVSLG